MCATMTPRLIPAGANQLAVCRTVSLLILIISDHKACHMAVPRGGSEQNRTQKTIFVSNHLFGVPQSLSSACTEAGFLSTPWLRFENRACCCDSFVLRAAKWQPEQNTFSKHIMSPPSAGG